MSQNIVNLAKKHTRNEHTKYNFAKQHLKQNVRKQLKNIKSLLLEKVIHETNKKHKSQEPLKWIVLKRKFGTNIHSQQKQSYQTTHGTKTPKTQRNETSWLENMPKNISMTTSMHARSFFSTFESLSFIDLGVLWLKSWPSRWSLTTARNTFCLPNR